MSDYTKSTNFTAKDNLTTGDPNKLIKGADFDTEFAAVAVASATKYDSGDICSVAEAKAETVNTKVVTPLRLSDWSEANAAMIGDIHALSDPGADKLLGWDNSATAVIAYTLGNGVKSATTSIEMDIGGMSEQVAIDSANDYLPMFDATDSIIKKISVADLVVSGGGAVPSSRTITSGTGMTGGGDLSADRTLNVVGGDGITANADDIALTNSAVTSSNPVGFTSGAPVFDMSSLTSIEGSALAATDVFLVEDAGLPKQIAVQDMGMRVQTGQTTQSLAAADMNSIMEFTGTATLTLPLNSTTDLPVGVPVVLNMKNATQELTVTAAASVTLVSIYHPAGAAAASDTVLAGGTAVLYKTATNVWALAGDIST